MKVGRGVRKKWKFFIIKMLFYQLERKTTAIPFLC